MKMTSRCKVWKIGHLKHKKITFTFSDMTQVYCSRSYIEHMAYMGNQMQECVSNQRTDR